jgi:Glycosyltransferase family 87
VAPPSSFNREWGWLLLAFAGALVAILAVGAPGLGDYPRDAGPAITAGAHGDLAGFFAHQAAMGPLSLYLRVPFAAIGVAIGDGALGVYRWASLPCLIALGLVAVWLARFAGQRGAGRLAQVLIVGVALLNPLVDSALYWGHPEEILTAALATGALVAALEQRSLAAGVLVGLAIASKQWALVLLLPVVLILARDRVRTAVLAVGLAALSSVPMMVGNFASFRHVFHYISSPQPIVTAFTWLYPFSPSGPVRISDINGGRPPFIGHQILPIATMLSHPLILLIGLGLPLLVWWRAGGRPTARELLTACALVLLLRCVLDPGSAAYYHLPLLLTLVVLDAWAGRRLPVLALTGTALAFIVLDRAPQYLAPAATNLLYIVASLTVAALLVRDLRWARRPRLMPGRAQPITAA